MPLTSPLFTASGPGKQLLERCAIANDGHFFPGMPNRPGLLDAVSRIRTALEQLGCRLGDLPGVYGKSTGDAVLKFKGPPRNLLGLGQRTPDNYVGIQTIARLDQEIQSEPPPPTPIGSTAWRFAFFGNKGFSGLGIYTLSIDSQKMQDFKSFNIIERFTSGTLRAGFKGESRGIFSTSRKAMASEFSRTEVVLQLFKVLLQDMLVGQLRLNTLGMAKAMVVTLPIVIHDETVGTSLTSGNCELRGYLP